jgi:hypothetical protein
MKNDRKPSGYWTKKQCLIEAKKYQTISEFRNESPSAYATSKANGWHKIVTKHLKRKKLPNFYWTKSMVLEEAKKYTNRSVFQTRSKKAWHAARANGWLDYVCKHMPVVGNKHKRALYAFEFDNKSVYVGLTYSYQNRYSQHLKRGVVAKNLKSNSATFRKYNIWLSQEKARIEEAKLINSYRKKGWVILNKAKAGALGGATRFWTKSRCREIALQFSTKNDLNKNYPMAFQTIYRRGWKNELFFHMTPDRNKNGYWSIRRLKLEAQKYRTRGEFAKGSRVAYKKAVEKKLLNRICAHMTAAPKGKTIYSKEICIATAKRFKSNSEFRKAAPSEYLACVRKGWIEEARAHMDKRLVPFRWSDFELKKEALKYKTKMEFANSAWGAYQACIARGLLDEFSGHMKSAMRKHYTKKQCLEIARLFNNRTDFHNKSRHVYDYARDKNWLDEICRQMGKRVKKSGG